ncbi:MAG: CBS domain-containing protein [Novosphingobium sp.]|jgi:CBS domain-containing protein
MKIAQLIESRGGEIHSCNADLGVAAAAKLLAERRIGALPVVNGDEVIGIFSERDLLCAVASEGASALERTVGEVMTAPAVTITADTHVLEALSLMTRRRFRHLPVVDGKRMTGFVSIGDLVKQRVELAESEARAMREYIQTA